MRLVVMALLLIGSLMVYATDETNIGNNQQVKVDEKAESYGSKKDNSSTEKKEAVGQKVYERFCVVCHRDGLVGAPKFRDDSSWKSRLSSKTMAELVNSALKGLNAMPAKGTCYECNEDDIKLAVEYMLPNHD